MTLDLEHDEVRWLPPDEATALCLREVVAAGVRAAVAAMR
jgi:hypothetical protein